MREDRPLNTDSDSACTARPHTCNTFKAQNFAACQRAECQRIPPSNIIGAVYHLALVALTLSQPRDLSVFLLPSVAYQALLGIAYIRRRRAVARDTRWFAQVIAYLAAYGPVLFAIAARAFAPAWVAPIHIPMLTVLSYGCAGAAVLLELWAICYLWPSFSVEPAARELVTGGPYRYLRHPVYVAGILGQLGLWLTHPTAPVTAMLAVWLPCLWVRMRYEERVLASTFPEYRARVGGSSAGLRHARNYRPQILSVGPGADPRAALRQPQVHRIGDELLLKGGH